MDRPLIILDLNGVLALLTRSSMAHQNAERLRSGKLLFRRPHVREFLAFLFEHFHVAVWTSNERWNANDAVAALFTDEQQAALKFVYTRDECTLMRNSYESRKDLTRVPYPIERVTMVDDTPDKITGARFVSNYCAVRSYACVNAADDELLHLRRRLAVMHGLDAFVEGV